jgi:hypothetical protein
MWWLILSSFASRIPEPMLAWLTPRPTDEAKLREGMGAEHTEYMILRGHLVKVAAIAVAWIEAIDRRTHGGTGR